MLSIKKEPLNNNKEIRKHGAHLSKSDNDFVWAFLRFEPILKKKD